MAFRLGPAAWTTTPAKDKHAGQIVPGTMDYTLSPEECKLIPMDGLEDKIVTIGVREISVWNNRVRVRGAFDLDELKGYLAVPAAVGVKSVASK